MERPLSILGQGLGRMKEPRLIILVIQSIPEGAYCDNCSYQPTGIRRVLPDGSGDNGVMLVGDGPWTEEVAAGKPFVGASGRWLDNLLVKRGLRREDFLVTNTTWCK